MNDEILEQRYWQSWNNSTPTESKCVRGEPRSRLEMEQAGEYVQPFSEWIEDNKHQYPNGF